MKNGRFQAKDIDDLDFLRALRSCLTPGRCAVSRDEVERRLSGFPWKVVLAKARALIGGTLMSGCACGCGGAWALTDNGRAFLAIFDDLAAAAAAQPPVAVLVGVDVEATGDPSLRRATVTLTSEATRFGFHFGRKATE